MSTPKDDKPKGKLTIEKVELRQIRDLSVYFDIYLKDEKGSIYLSQTASFLHALEKVEKKGERNEQTTTPQKHLPK